MAIRSMTGYGRAAGELAPWTLRVELRSVNHRGLDVRFMAPAELAFLEIAVRDRIRRHCGRGRIECRLSLRSSPTADVPADVLERATRLRSVLAEVNHHLDLDSEVGLQQLLLAGLNPLVSDERPDLQHLSNWALAVLDRALDELVVSRDTEGVVLRDEYRRRLNNLRDLVTRIEHLSLRTSLEHIARVQERLGELMGTLSSPEDQPLDERLVQEVASAMDKSDITEEVVRARSHATVLLEIFRQADAAEVHEPMGKKVDFFLQELIRESNTMASKSMSAEMTTIIVETKVEIERMREQAHNLE